MNAFEQAKQKKERGVSSLEILEDFIRDLDDYDSIFILGKKKSDGDLIIS